MIFLLLFTYIIIGIIAFFILFCIALFIVSTIIDLKIKRGKLVPFTMVVKIIKIIISVILYLLFFIFSSDWFSMLFSLFTFMPTPIWLKGILFLLFLIQLLTIIIYKASRKNINALFFNFFLLIEPYLLILTILLNWTLYINLNPLYSIIFFAIIPQLILLMIQNIIKLKYNISNTANLITIIIFQLFMTFFGFICQGFYYDIYNLKYSLIHNQQPLLIIMSGLIFRLIIYLISKYCCKPKKEEDNESIVN